ncbi:hypothetical protein FA13DRAFT_1790913 [Coprinellus micaceus]|uniref:Uncharacterized protein n=1 Tax=Coprinellus micaceus TaxID=71717 RepID=A0A4Y7TDM7_COPMI|nr:hypothetical protein FA13DRAFT_1790913 [Coprinellus micaceus]
MPSKHHASIPASTSYSDRSDSSEIEEEDLPPSATLSLSLLTPEVEQLLTCLPEYLAGKQKARRATLKGCAQVLVDAREEAGTPFLPAEVGALPVAIEHLFAKHTPKANGKSALVKTTRSWGLYSVIQSVKRDEVREQRGILYAKYIASKQYQADLKIPNAVKSPIAFQAPAVKHIESHLTPGEVEEFEKLASQWTQDKPPAETRRRNAVKHLTQEVQQFSQRAYNTMDARLFVLAAYLDEAGNVVTLPLDFSQVVGEPSFYDQQKAMIDSSDVLYAWNKFNKQVLKVKPVPSSTPQPTAAHIRPGVRALMVLHENNYHKPLIVNVYYPPDDIKEKQWLADVLRSVFSRFYALAQGRPGVRVRFPWKKFREETYSFVDAEYFPERLVKHFGEPSTVDLIDLQTVTKALYNQMVRARKIGPDEPYFQFHSWWNEGSKAYVPASPRSLRKDVTLPDRAPGGSTQKKSVMWAAPSDDDQSGATEPTSRPNSPSKRSSGGILRTSSRSNSLGKAPMPTPNTSEGRLRTKSSAVVVPAVPAPALPERKRSRNRSPAKAGGMAPSNTPHASIPKSTRTRGSSKQPPPHNEEEVVAATSQTYARRKRSASKTPTGNPSQSPEKARARSTGKTPSPSKPQNGVTPPCGRPPARTRSPTKPSTNALYFPSPEQSSASQLLLATQQPLQATPLSFGYRSPSKKGRTQKKAMGRPSQPVVSRTRSRSRDDSIPHHIAENNVQEPVDEQPRGQRGRSKLTTSNYRGGERGRSTTRKAKGKGREVESEAEEIEGSDTEMEEQDESPPRRNGATPSHKPRPSHHEDDEIEEEESEGIEEEEETDDIEDGADWWGDVQGNIGVDGENEDEEEDEEEEEEEEAEEEEAAEEGEVAEEEMPHYRKSNPTHPKPAAFTIQLTPPTPKGKKSRSTSRNPGPESIPSRPHPGLAGPSKRRGVK